jgi:tRNA (guanine10-N2)-dimethyltransferase
MITCILGRQPAFGLAELESRFGATNITPFGDSNIAAQIATDANDIPFHLLGSVIKFARPLTTYDSVEWSTLITLASETLSELLQSTSEGKIKIGISVYDLPVSLKALQRSSLELKKAIRANGHSVRVVPNTSLELNSAQIIHNRLTSDVGYELLFIRDGRQTHLARTLYVQNIDDYAQRDFGRPMRDAFVGMLPPKLAQTMLNLAQVNPDQRVLDPFCGTGVVMQEAALMGANVYGTDINERMVRYTRDNLNWLKDIYHVDFDMYLETADAADATWQPPLDSVVCETYLGQPLTQLPDPKHLQPIIDECNDITSKFLTNLRGQLATGTRCCIAVPAWFDGRNFMRLQVVDDLEKMGYNRISFKRASFEDLIYHRKDQVVARELLVITVKE